MSFRLSVYNLLKGYAQPGQALVMGTDGHWQPGAAGAVLWVGDDEPTDGSVFWYDTDDTCEPCCDPGGIWDDFTRANAATLGTSSSGHAWSALSGTWSIVSNTAQMTGGTGTNNTACLETSLADCTVSVHVFTGLPGGGGLAWRVVDNSNHWFWVLDSSGGGNGSSVYKSVAGTLTQVATGLASFANDTMSVELSGSTMTLKKNGTTVTTITDSTHSTATKHGLHGYAGYEVFDDFSINGAGPVTGRPLKLWDGSAWQVVACMVPA